MQDDQEQSVRALRTGISASGSNGVRFGLAVALGVTLASSGSAGLAQTTVSKAEGADMSVGSGVRDGDVAIRQEFDAAAQQNTVAAWELFLARHPEHALAAEARERLQVLKSAMDQPVTEPLTPRDGDVAIRQEFDAANEANTVQAWQMFIARHPDHALAHEARERLLLAQSQPNEPIKEPYPPRDGDVAIRQEFDAANEANTVQAWQMFLARHPNHRLAAEARERLTLLQTSGGELTKERVVARDGDIAIRQEFDAANRTNTRAAWAMFIARHPDHPLTAEAIERLGGLNGN